MGLMGLVMACYSGLYATPTGLANSTDHPSRTSLPLQAVLFAEIIR